MIRKLPAPADDQGRVETGAVQFGDDWPGLFIRGDNALRLQESILKVIKHIEATSQSKDFMVALAVDYLQYIAEEIENNVTLQFDRKATLKRKKAES